LYEPIPDPKKLARVVQVAAVEVEEVEEEMSSEESDDCHFLLGH
jgi:hypothetical protein